MKRNAEFERKKQKALEILSGTGMWRSNYAPPLYRLLWRMGMKLRPLPFNTFSVNVLLSGGYFALFWGIFMWFSTWQPRGYHPLTALIVAASAGLLFGLMMAAFYKWRLKAKQLPTWEEL